MQWQEHAACASELCKHSVAYRTCCFCKVLIVAYIMFILLPAGLPRHMHAPAQSHNITHSCMPCYTESLHALRSRLAGALSISFKSCSTSRATYDTIHWPPCGMHAYGPLDPCMGLCMLFPTEPANGSCSLDRPIVVATKYCIKLDYLQQNCYELAKAVYHSEFSNKFQSEPSYASEGMVHSLKSSLL